MNPQIIGIVNKIMALGIKISSETSTDVFVWYSGHTHSLTVQVHLGGWEKKEPEASNVDYGFTFYIDEPETLSLLRECLKELNYIYQSEKQSREAV